MGLVGTIRQLLSPDIAYDLARSWPGSNGGDWRSVIRSSLTNKTKGHNGQRAEKVADADAN